MLIRRTEETSYQEMTMPGAKDVTMQLMLGREDQTPTFAMRQFQVQPQGHTPRHQHNYEHEAFILEGQGQIIGGIDGSTIRPIGPGDAIFIAANEMHQFRNTGTQVLRFLCLIPNSFDCGNACQPTPGS